MKLWLACKHFPLCRKYLLCIVIFKWPRFDFWSKSPSPTVSSETSHVFSTKCIIWRVYSMSLAQMVPDTLDAEIYYFSLVVYKYYELIDLEDTTNDLLWNYTSVYSLLCVYLFWSLCLRCIRVSHNMVNRFVL